jgi:hypothetical protein
VQDVRGGSTLVAVRESDSEVARAGGLLAARVHPANSGRGLIHFYQNNISSNKKAKKQFILFSPHSIVSNRYIFFLLRKRAIETIDAYFCAYALSN